MAAADCLTVITKGLVSEPPAMSTKATTEKLEKSEERVLITPTSSSSYDNESNVLSSNNEVEASTSGLLHTLPLSTCMSAFNNVYRPSCFFIS